MDQINAQFTAQALIGDLASGLSTELWEIAASRALTLDSAGRHPGDEGYQSSYDPHWLAAEAVSILAVQSLAGDGVREFTSEGATFKLSAPDLHRMAAELRAQSALSRLAGSKLGVIEADGRLSDYAPRSGRGRKSLSVLPNGAVVPSALDWT